MCSAAVVLLLCVKPLILTWQSLPPTQTQEEEFVAGDVTLPKREVEGEEDDEEAIARRRAAIRERLKRLQLGACVCRFVCACRIGDYGI